MLFSVLAILFLATFIRSAFGFGEALVAVPLLAFVMPVEAAAPLAVMVSITVSVVAVAQDWRHIHFRSVGRLFLATMVGTPLGLLALNVGDGRIVKAALAMVIIAFSTFSLLGRARATLHDDSKAWIFGFGAGVLGGAYGMNGPPLVMYGALRGWSPQRFRATLQGYFLPASLMVLGGYGLTGLWTASVNRHYLLALPVVVLAILLGRAANRRMNARVFTLCVHLGLIVVGSLLLLQAIAGPKGG